MGELRQFGKEVTIRLSQGGAPLGEITAIRNFVFETRHRIVSEGYLGETALRQDEIFDEIGGSFSVHPEGSQIFQLQRLIFERSSRRTQFPTQISCTFRSAFPNGSSVRISIPDMKFDPIPYNVGGRDAYTEMSFTWKSSSYTLTV